MIFKKNKISCTMAVAAMALTFSGTVLAETGDGTASVVVQNNFDVTESQALSFGTVVAFADGAAATDSDTATLVVSPDGTTTDAVTPGTNASLLSVAPGTRAIFDVTGASPDTVLTIILPSDFTLTDPSSATDAKIFTVTDFTQAIVTSGSAFTYDTDSSGNLSFAIGATLGTDNTDSGSSGAVAYENITFTGTYTVDVNY